MAIAIAIVSPVRGATAEEILAALGSLGIAGSAKDFILCHLRPAVWGNYDATVEVPGSYVSDGKARRLQIRDGVFSVQPGEGLAGSGITSSPWPEQVTIGSGEVAFARGAPFFLSGVRLSGNTVTYSISSNPSVTVRDAYTSVETINPAAANDFTQFYRSWLGSSGIASDAASRQLSFTLPWPVLAQNTNLFSLKTRGTNMTCLQANSVDLNRPSAAAADVVLNGASFAAGFASSAFVTILGGNLASATRAWQQTDFADGRLPVRVEGVSVEINGRPAYVSYVSPRQLNVLAPDDPAEGRVRVEVITPMGRSAVTATKTSRAPAFFLFDPEGRKYVAAVHPDGTYVAKPGLYPGLATTPARPGETIMLFGNGFGPTNPPSPAGEILREPYRLDAPVSVQVGGVEAAVSWAGKVGPGLYQLNVRIPDAAGGDLAVIAAIGGFQTPSGAFLTIQR